MFFALIRRLLFKMFRQVLSMLFSCAVIFALLLTAPQNQKAPVKGRGGTVGRRP